MRKLAVLAVGVLIGVLGFTAMAGAAGVVRPTRVTASVLPPHRDKAPFKWTASGKLVFPSEVCSPGITNPAYCIPLTAAEVCKGSVKITIYLHNDGLLKKSNYRLKTVTANVGPKCTYSVSVKFKTSIFTAQNAFQAHARGAYANLSFTPVYSGNAILSGYNVHTQHVLAKVQQP